MKRLIWLFDMMVYRLFYWRWNRRLQANAHLCMMFKYFIDAHVERSPEEVEKLNKELRKRHKP